MNNHNEPIFNFINSNLILSKSLIGLNKMKEKSALAILSNDL